ncbi:MAG TPA: TPM domain-containing protein, partial [Verrucomicrobiae bacterium]|nr:TPM domain-containing protein [Verrucomicrobiae bacterium]
MLFVATSSSHALDVPQLQGHVNDYARMLSPDASARVESALQEFESKESTQIVVLTLPSLEGETMEEFSIRVAEAWKLGHKGVDNGVILLLAQKERKIRIEVGRGLEGRLTDLTSGRIIRGEIAPRLRSGDADGAISAGVAALMEVVKGEAGAKPDLRQGKKSISP